MKDSDALAEVGLAVVRDGIDQLDIALGLR